MDDTKTCMVTGHRDLPAENLGNIKKELRREILQAIQDGCTHFVSGFAQGTDLLFADIVAELAKIYPITLEAAIPYRKRLNTTHPDFQRLIAKCKIVRVHSEEYSQSCFLLRNRNMVQQSDLVIALYDGRSEGGTLYTIRYAHKMGKEVRMVKFKEEADLTISLLK